MVITRSKFLATLTLCAVTLSWLNVNAQADDSASDEPIEEIIVKAPQTWNSMRADILRAERKVFDLYNKLNTDSDYDIRCRAETPLSSHIPRRVCTPRFMDDLYAQAARDFIDFGISFDFSANAEDRNKILHERMLKMIEENPALYDAMLEYYEAGKVYEDAREERWGKRD